MISQLLPLIQKLLIDSIYAELRRIGRDVVPTDNVSTFQEIEGRFEDLNGITKEGVFTSDGIEYQSVRFFVDSEWITMDLLAALLEDLQKIDDHRTIIHNLGIAVLETMGIQVDEVKAIDEDAGSNWIALNSGKVYGIQVYELGYETLPIEHEQTLSDPLEAVDDDLHNSEEGWMLAACEGGPMDGYYQIQRDDEAGIFASDEEAYNFVQEKAAGGNLRYQRALDAHNTPFRPRVTE